MISIVCPVYLGESTLSKLVNRIVSAIEKLNVDYEIILVDDRSPDKSWQIMKQLANKIENLKCIRLSRNFGQHAAIFAGLSETKGDWVVILDCDLQDNPDEIGNLYLKAQEGSYDAVMARRTNRQDGIFKRFSSKIFYWMFNYLADLKLDHSIANFGIYNKKIIDEVCRIGDSVKFFPLFVHWVGFKTTSIPVNHSAGLDRNSSYTFGKLFKLAVNVILAFSDKPLRIILGAGLLISMFALIGGVFIILSVLMNKTSVPGYASIMVSIWFFSGLIITMVGVVGIYISKLFDQVKKRPIFIIDKII